MILGIDEVGRGCWAGPLVVAAVTLADTVNIAGLTDSKTLSAKARIEYAKRIKDSADFSFGWVWPQEVDTHGLTAATRFAITRALSGMKNIESADIVIDGSYNFLPDMKNVRTMIKADYHIAAVSAASIIAKVARDSYMQTIAGTYPDYGFDAHVGYGTARHKAALMAHGVTPIHRLSFRPVKKVTESKRMFGAAT